MKTAHDYLLDMREYANCIAQSTRGGKAAFDSDFVVQDAVIRQYQVIGEIAKRLPDELLATQPDIDWRAVKGFRDFLTHNYDRVDLAIVWEAVMMLPQLQQAIEAMLAENSNNNRT
ncbi:HepT-like ribonuclease domain-containing protein [Aggregatilineales bacterium SYSU G02658]